MPETCRLIRVIASSFAVVALFIGTAHATSDDPSIDVPTEVAEGTPAEAAEGTPEGVVDSLHTALLGVMMDAESLGYQGRFDALKGVVPELFDIPFMAEKSVGRYWKKATEEEREELLATFSEFMVANYAGNFDGFSGETFERLDTVDSTHGTQLVRTRLKESDGDIVQLDYRLRKIDARCQIIDIYLNGTVSELALRRSEYSTLIQNEGFTALLDALRKKVEDLSEG